MEVTMWNEPVGTYWCWRLRVWFSVRTAQSIVTLFQVLDVRDQFVRCGCDRGFDDGFILSSSFWVTASLSKHIVVALTKRQINSINLKLRNVAESPGCVSLLEVDLNSILACRCGIGFGKLLDAELLVAFNEFLVCVAIYETVF